MTHKSAKVAALTARFAGHGFDARYLGYFDCFNRGLYYEAHDVLEDLWLEDRRGCDGDFHRGLIQFAGAFVLIGKRRPRGALALLRLVQGNLSRYPSPHLGLDVTAVLTLADAWSTRLEAAGCDSAAGAAPHIRPPQSTPPS